MKTSRLEIRIEPELKKAAQDKAEKDGVKLSKKVTKLLEDDLKTYDIVNMQLTHPSFKWGNGLYLVIDRLGDELRMCKLGRDLKPELFNDGRFMITCTGVNNKEVYKTQLKITL